MYNTNGRSISQKKYPGADNYNGLYNDEHEAQPIARGTLFSYVEDGEYKCGVCKAKTVQDVTEQNGVDKDYRYMIGGGDLVLNGSDDEWNESFLSEQFSFGQSVKYDGLVECGRTAIGLKQNGIDGRWMAYLTITKSWNGTPLNGIRTFLKDTLKCEIGIFLDGSASTQMRCYDGDTLKERRGFKIVVDDRPVWNMIRVI